jgi:stage III sporulation protein SpoIIIAA
MNVNDDLEKLIENLPFFLQEHLNQHIYKDQLIEIVLRFRSTT